jgi:hypothetical protein
MKFNKKIDDIFLDLESIKRDVIEVHRLMSLDAKRHSHQYNVYQLMQLSIRYQMLANEMVLELKNV